MGNLKKSVLVFSFVVLGLSSARAEVVSTPEPSASSPSIEASPTPSASGSEVLYNPWSHQSSPSKGEPLIYGSHEKGCIGGALTLEPQGKGYLLARSSRNRLYGHPDLLAYIRSLGENAEKNHWGSLMVGDLAQPRGGPTMSGHNSHQTGLDVDIWYRTANAAESGLPAKELEGISAVSVVAKNKKKHPGLERKHWGKSQQDLVIAAASDPHVDRIFVDASIKKELCALFPKAKWLHNLRPWWKHDDHFHVRLKCPASSPGCELHGTTPPGSGCDASLEWWFSEEAKKKWLEMVAQHSKPVLPVLPAQCEEVLKAP
jgi:penicillin-insensitive murein endopeptidase